MMKKVITGLLLVFLVFFAFQGLVVVKDYVGYATHAGKGGNIYELLIKHPIPVTQWAGQFGVAVRADGYNFLQSENLVGGEIESENLLFNCLEPDIPHEIYASVYPDFDLSSAFPADPADVDTFYQLDPIAVDLAVNTFTKNITFDLGTLSITAPGTYTYEIGNMINPVTFATAAIEDAQGRIGFMIYATTNFTFGFSGEVVNYQALLPMMSNQTETKYYFYTDPNDVCPEGEGEEPPRCTVEGNVTTESGTALADVIVDVAGNAALTNPSGFYNLSTRSGAWRIFGIKEDYYTHVNNLTCPENETVYYNFVMVEITNETNPDIGPGTDSPGDSTQDNVDIGPNQDLGPGQSDGEDVGPGEIPPVPFVEEPKEIEGIDYVISLSELKRKIRVDQFHQEALYVYSFRKQPINVEFKIVGDENLSRLLSLDRENIVVEPNSNENIVITIFGRQPIGIFEGNLTIDGDINATIPIEIEIIPKERSPVEALIMTLETNQKETLPGEQFKFKSDMRNMLLDYPYTVNLFYTIQPLNGNGTVWQYQTNVFLKTAFSIIRTVNLPKDLEPGDYILRANAEYLDFTSSVSTIFRVNVPFWQRTMFGLKNWLWLLILLFLLACVTAGFMIYRNIQSKKKYHLKVELDELPKPGPRNIFVGKIAETEHKTYMNLENFKVHTIVAGSTGGGKSVSAQVVVEEALDRGVSIICFDPTAQWTGMLRPCKDKMMFSLYPFFGMKKNEAKAYNGNVRMILDPKELIDIKKYYKPGEIQVFACHKLDPKDMDIVVANAIREIFHANFQESKPLKIMFVFDEVHRLLPKFGGSGDGFLQIERACREFRKWGLGVMLISQVLSDFVGTIKANINTEIQMRTRDEGDLERIRQKYGEDVLRSLVKATVGTGLVENPAYNRGKPYFIAFRPLKHSVERMADEEIEEYNKYNDMVDELEFSLEQLEEEGVDIFDLKLELKLALDKVKQGNFNMVKIYVDGLKPRIDKQWEKIGKKPRKYERKLVDMKELKKDLEQAEKERAEYEANEESNKPVEQKKEWEWADDAPPDKILDLSNGMVVLSLANLYDEIAAMKDKDWEAEVDDNHNNLADWVLNTTGLEKLAANLYATIDKDEAIKILDQFKQGGLDALDDKKLPDKRGSSEDKKDDDKKEGKKEESTAEKKEPSEDKTEESKPKEAEPKEQSPAGDAKSEPPEKLEATEQEYTEDKSEKSDSKVGEKEEAPPKEKPEIKEPVESGIKKAIVDSEDDVIRDAEDKIKEQKKALESEINSEARQKTEAPQPKRHYENLVTGDPAEFFRLEDGTEIKGVEELAEKLETMDESIFKNHVSDDYNHFADWIRGVFHANDLAEEISHAKTKDEIRRAIA